MLSCQGHLLEGCLTSLLILAPGLASCCLELRAMWRGHGHCGLALAQLGLCPLTSLLTHLYSIFNPRWRPRALLQKTMEVMRIMMMMRSYKLLLFRVSCARPRSWCCSWRCGCEAR